MATQAPVRGLFIDMTIIIAVTVVTRNVMGLPFVRGVVSREVGSVGQGAVALTVGAAVDRRREAAICDNAVNCTCTGKLAGLAQPCATQDHASHRIASASHRIASHRIAA